MHNGLEAEVFTFYRPDAFPFPTNSVKAFHFLFIFLFYFAFGGSL